MKTLFHNMNKKKHKVRKSINLDDGIDRRIRHLPIDIYGFEQDYSEFEKGGVLRFPVISGKVIIVDPNDICDYFNEESREKCVIHSHGVVVSQHGCSGWLFNFGNIYRLFNFGSKEKNSIVYFDNDIITPISLDKVCTWEKWETPFSNCIDTDVCCLAIIDYVDAVQEIAQNDSGRRRIIDISHVCEIGYEHITDDKAKKTILNMSDFDQSLSMYIKSAQQVDAPEAASPPR